MNQQRAGSDDLGGLQKAEDRVPQEECSQSAALLGPIHCQPAQKDDGNGLVPRQSLDQAGIGCCRVDRTGRKRVIADDLAVHRDDVDAGCARGLTLQRVFLKTVVECRFSAIEPFNSVDGRQRLGPEFHGEQG